MIGRTLLIIASAVLWLLLGAVSVAIARYGIVKGKIEVTPATWRFVVRVVLFAWPLFWGLIAVFGLQMLLKYLDEVPTPTIEVKK